MSWLLPSALAIAGAAALVTVALHFIANSRPLAEPLPTARFVPERALRARTRSIAFSDALLLLVRVAAIAAIGAGAAAPVIASARGRIARVVLVDRSRAVIGAPGWRDSIRATLRPGDVTIAFDSAATPLTARDSLTPLPVRGSLSAALAAAIRSAATLARVADSAELVIVSPVVAEELDAATLRIRGAWPGRVRIVRVAAAAARPVSAVVETTADANDPVIAGLSLIAPVRADGWIRVARAHLTAADTAWAREAGHVLVHWPASDTAASWRQRAAVDAIGAVSSASGTVVARLPRTWALTGAAIARWPDGEPAAVEHAVGGGCIRDVAILLDDAGDVTLRASFQAFAQALLAPCGGARDLTAADGATIATLQGSGQLAAAASLVDREGERSPLTPWLLALGAALLTIELALRRGRGAKA